MIIKKFLRLNKKVKFIVALWLYTILWITLPHNAFAVATDPIGSWVSEPNLPYTLASHLSFTGNNRLFVLGGAGEGDISHREILSANISSSGALSNWSTLINKLPYPLIWHSGVQNGNRFYILGGAIRSNQGGMSSVSTVYTTTVQPNGDLQDWIPLRSLPEPLSLGQAVIWNNRIFHAGGATWTNGIGPVLNDNVYSAIINQDGTINSWESLTPLPEPRGAFAMSASNNHLLIMGGEIQGVLATSTVLSSEIQDDGTIDSWKELTPLPQPLHRPGFALKNGFFIIAGGWSGSNAVDSIYFAPLNPDGLPGEWTKSISKLPTVSCCFPLTATNTHLYTTGGHNKDAYLTSVYKAPFTVVPTPTPTPTPTTTPTPKTSLVLLPGFGASWNKEKLFFGQEVPQSEWKMNWFAKSYDGLIETLEKAGYKKGEDFFIFNYDWTKPVDQIAADLKTYIEETINPPPEGKIDLLGHSLGGLVARAYVQRNPDTNKVDRLITLGSPHKGVPQVYKAWEGADLHNLSNVPVRLGAELLLAFRGKDFKNKVETLRNTVPLMRDLLPIFDYLKWANSGQVIPESSLPESSQNLWLKNLGAPPSLLNLLSAIVGTVGEAPRWLKVVPRDKIDEILGRWESGKVVETNTENGDDTVLSFSAQLEGAKEISLLSLSHAGLVQNEEGIRKILAILGKDGVEPVIYPPLAWEPTLVFALASPANIRVTDPQGRQIGVGIDLPTIPEATYSAEEKMIIIPQAIQGEYRLEVIGEGSGSYRLLVGQMTEKNDVWTEYQETTSPGETDTFTLPFDQTLTTTDTYLAKLINEKIEALFKEIKNQRISLRVKGKIAAQLTKVWIQTKPLPLLLNLKQNRRADENAQKAIIESRKLSDYLEIQRVDTLLPRAREIQDLLSQLHDLL